jgi:16S rRNA (guanine527-N7)-methyltransferase
MQKRIRELLEKAGIAVSETEAGQLAEYLALMERWNTVYNLTSIVEPEEMIQRHLVESLAFKPYLRGTRIADVGSGAGLPGIPLAITTPGLAMTLIESRGKKARFLRHVQGTLNLINVSVAHSRAEDLTPVPPFDTVLARAVAAPPELLALTRHLLAREGILLVLTKANYRSEATELGDDVRVRRVEDSVTASLQGSLFTIETADG